MIFLEKPPAPQVLNENFNDWTNDLLDAVTRYNGYSKIPRQEKESLLRYYKHVDIKNVLFTMSSEKCVFCEGKPGENGNIEIEHFIPKSIYPQVTFDWHNLLPSCRKCNESKSTLDTTLEPIINPCEDDPENFFEYDYLFIRPKHSLVDKTIAERTIDEVSLNSPRLFNARADILFNLSSYLMTAENHIKDIEESSSPRVQRNKLNKLRSSIEVIDLLTLKDQKYSAFTKNYLSKDRIYQKAKSLLLTE